MWQQPHWIFKWLKKDPQRVSNIKAFINSYNWEGINHLWKIGDWKIFEKNNLRISLNILHIKEKKIFPAYILKINSNCKK